MLHQQDCQSECRSICSCNRGNAAVKTFTNCYNTGNITIEEGATIVNLYTGGCFGKFDAAPAIDENGLRTTGSVKVLNGASESVVNRVGGVVGWNATTISNAQVFCDVVGIGVDGVGMVTGMDRGTSASVSNCKLGGRIATELNNNEPVYKTVSEILMESEDSNGDFVTNPNYIPFWNVIYGGTWADASESNRDGCSYISEITIE